MPASARWVDQTLTIGAAGKVHGSLARAGKVRGQTPHQDKAEGKKKLPRGRAFKRLQYNRFSHKAPGREC